jgi:hypothetical protein
MAKHKGSLATVVIVLIIIAAIIAAVVYSKKQKATEQPVVNEVRESVTENSPTLTQAQAEALVKKEWGPCAPDSCSNLSVAMNRNDFGQIRITAIYSLMDDSVAKSKKEALAVNTGGTWHLGHSIDSFSCQSGRGHTNFSIVSCK